MGQRAFEKTFCKVCGVNVGNEAAHLSEEELAALPEKLRGLHKMAQTVSPTNLRVLNDFDLGGLKDAKRVTDGALAEPKYVNP
jgi:hypothetical protein